MSRDTETRHPSSEAWQSSEVAYLSAGHQPTGGVADHWRSTTTLPSMKVVQSLHHKGSLCLVLMMHFAILLALTSSLCMDGNCSMSPRVFQQLYVIRAPLGETAVLCVYALLPNKSHYTYQHMLQVVRT